MGYEGKGKEWTIEKMTTIADRDTQLVKEVDAGVKNQWKFEWLEKTTDFGKCCIEH